jgi:tetratricopeptide (TPR) repeat protein
VAGALGLLLAISGAVWAFRQTHPWLIVGWLWYLGMMIPIIGIVQISYYAHADRYTYLPQIGLYLLLTWTAADLCAGWRYRRVVLGGFSTIILIALIFCARTQVSYWRNDELLWTHTVACTSDNYYAHDCLGFALFQKGSVDEAIAHYQKALQIKPDYVDAHIDLGIALSQKGSVDEAMAYFQKALQIKPDYAKAHYNLGNALLQKGRVDEAIAHYQTALQINPDAVVAHDKLGVALSQKGSVDEAIAHFQKALQINPDYAKAHCNLGSALLKKGRVDEAIVQYQKTLQIKPNYLEAQNNLAWVLATAPQASLRNGHQAVQLAQQANQLVGGENPIILHTLAAAYAEAGQISDARRSAQKAMALAREAGQSALMEQLNSELKLYAAGLPFHQENK